MSLQNYPFKSSHVSPEVLLLGNHAPARTCAMTIDLFRSETRYFFTIYTFLAHVTAPGLAHTCTISRDI